MGATDQPVRKIILKQSQSPGDHLTFSRGAYDFARAYPEWEVDIHTACPELFENNPYTTPLKESDPEVEVYNITYDEIHQSGWRGHHFADAFRNDIAKEVNSDPAMVATYGEVVIPSTGLHPEIFLTDDEKSWFNQVHCTYHWDGPYWILNAGRKSDNELKQYHRWQAVADILNAYFQGKVRIVQIGHRGSVDMHHIHPDLKGVFNLVSYTDNRQLIRLAYWAAGGLGPISFQFVLMAAFEKPNVVVAGGKEGTRWHIYNEVQWIKKNGCLPCAMSDGCWLGGKTGKCANLVTPPDIEQEVPLCFEITTPQEIANRVIDYYAGGRLVIPDAEQWIEDGKDKYESHYQAGTYPEPKVTVPDAIEPDGIQENGKGPFTDAPALPEYTVEQVAKMLSINQGTIITWIERGILPGMNRLGEWVVFGAPGGGVKLSPQQEKEDTLNK